MSLCDITGFPERRVLFPECSLRRVIFYTPPLAFPTSLTHLPFPLSRPPSFVEIPRRSTRPTMSLPPLSRLAPLPCRMGRARGKVHDLSSLSFILPTLKNLWSRQQRCPLQPPSILSPPYSSHPTRTRDEPPRNLASGHVRSLQIRSEQDPERDHHPIHHIRPIGRSTFQLPRIGQTKVPPPLTKSVLPDPAWTRGITTLSRFLCRKRTLFPSAFSLLPKPSPSFAFYPNHPTQLPRPRLYPPFKYNNTLPSPDRNPKQPMLRFILLHPPQRPPLRRRNILRQRRRCPLHSHPSYRDARSNGLLRLRFDPTGRWWWR